MNCRSSMELSTAIVIIAMVAVIAFLIGFIGGSQIAHNQYDSFHLLVEKPAGLPDQEINRVFKDKLELMLIREGLTVTKRDRHTVTKQFEFYIKTEDDEE